METIKVNMTPCEDIKTIHASQNDNEAREWGFELHNNGEKIDSSSISDQMVFKAYEGGTEQILPENTSTPTTSPFKGDIKYPQGLLTDQEFTYRESPTESDGLAFIESIKGNTLVWNQLVNPSRATQTVNGVTYTNNNDGSYTINGTATATSLYQTTNADISIIQGHKYLLKGANGGSSNCRLDVRTSQGTVLDESINIGTDKLFTASVTDNCMVMIRVGNGTTVSNIKFIPQLFDLTKMGLGSITSASEFTSLFSLPYYDYNQGTLLSFNGNSIKTVSKNQFDTSVVTTSYAGLTLTTSNGTIRAVYSGGSQYAGFNFYGSPVFTDTFLKGRYRLSFDVKGLDTQWTVGLRQGASFVGTQAVAISNDGHYSFTIDAEANPNCYLSFARTGNKTTAYDVTFSNIQLELGTTETSYTPFEEKTISLPISQYFPWGMDGVGTAYDELANSGYVKRIGAVDLGSLTWGYSQERSFFTSTEILELAKKPSRASNLANILCAKYQTISENDAYFQLAEGIALNTNGKVRVRDTSFTDVTAFTNSLQGQYLYYELATPLENYGVVDLGSLTWDYQSNYQRFRASFTDAKQPSTSNLVGNILCPLYLNVSMNNHTTITDMTMALGAVGYDYLYVRNLAYTDATAFKQAMQGVYLLYEKENPQGFTTATLVTENGETPLSNNGGVLIGKCTEQLSAEPGFHDAKIKLADEDGECYSNKIQLHIERSPQ